MDQVNVASKERTVSGADCASGEVRLSFYVLEVNRISGTVQSGSQTTQ